MAAPLIDIRNAWKIYYVGDVDVPAVQDVSLAIPYGQFLAITGASGSGKSTFMHLIGCLDQLTRGSFHFDGQQVSSLSRHELAVLRNRRIGFVFQNFNLLSRTTILDNVALPLAYQRVPLRERRDLHPSSPSSARGCRPCGRAPWRRAPARACPRRRCPSA